MASGPPAATAATMTGVVDAFRRLSTRDSRRRALEALTSELTPHEWRTLHALTGARSFQRDIVGQLPLELAALVFSHLDTASPYRLRLVSKQWNHILRSLSVLHGSLNSWYRGSVDLSSTDHASCERMARRVRRFRRGLPTSTFKLRMGAGVETSKMTSFLVGNTLVWFVHGGRAAHMLRLDTWTLRALHGDGREQIYNAEASDQLVAIITHLNFCYVSMLDGQGRKSFKMPNSNFDFYACRERTVALAAIYSRYITVFIWNYDTEQGTSFDISRHPSHGFFALDSMPNHKCIQLQLILQPKSETVVVIGGPSCGSDVLECSFDEAAPFVWARFTYSGQCIHSSPAPQMDLNILYVWTRWRVTPVDPTGHVHVVHLYCSGSTMAVQYDEQVDKFTEIHCPTTNYGLAVSECVGWWNDTFYESRTDEENGSPYLVVLRTGYVYDVNGSVYVQNALTNGSSEESIDDKLRIYGEEEDAEHPCMKRVELNESYLVYPVLDGIYIHCFDEPSGGPPTRHGKWAGIGDWDVMEGSSHLSRSGPR